MPLVSGERLVTSNVLSKCLGGRVFFVISSKEEKLNAGRHSCFSVEWCLVHENVDNSCRAG